MGLNARNPYLVDPQQQASPAPTVDELVGFKKEKHSNIANKILSP
jgi:hypothetical protein